VELIREPEEVAKLTEFVEEEKVELTPSEQRMLEALKRAFGVEEPEITEVDGTKTVIVEYRGEKINIAIGEVKKPDLFEPLSLEGKIWYAKKSPVLERLKRKLKGVEEKEIRRPTAGVTEYGALKEYEQHEQREDEELAMAAKTAITRKGPSLPTRILEQRGLLRGKILDYGSGKGADVEYLKSKGYDIVGFDPYYKPDYHLLTDETYDTVLCNYVLNVVFPETRHEVLQNIRRILKDGGVAFITVRDISEKVTGKPYKNGVITAKGTFQKLFSPEELVNLVKQYFEEVVIINRRQPLIVMAKKLTRTHQNRGPLKRYEQAKEAIEFLKAMQKRR